MQPPSYTKIFHKKSYPAIDPTRPELSHEGKTVVVTGAGSGIGQATCLSYAKSGAAHIILIGRRSGPLEETRNAITSLNLQPPPRLTLLPLSINDESAITSAFSTHAPLDILINCAAFLSDKGSILSTSLSNFWTAFETNVRAPFILAQHFLRNCRKEDSVIIGVNSFIAHIPASAVSTAPASYACSKIATAKLMEYIASENTGAGVRAYSVHPGIIETEMSKKSRAMAEGQPLEIVWDEVQVASDFMVWLSSKRGKETVPSGRFVWANWDVDELERRREELWKSETALTVGLVEAPMAAPERVE